jgi:CRISPR/Cas system-associated protein Csm6
MVIISTVGTSLLTNLLKTEVRKSFGFDIGETTSEKITSGVINKIPVQIEAHINQWIEGNEKFPVDNIYKINKNSCAEIKSILAIASEKPATIHLLCTDTFASYFSGEKIQKALNRKNDLTVKLHDRITGLSLTDKTKFETTGIDSLIGVLDEIYKNANEKNTKNEDIILNISGGYKALIPIMTIIGQIKKSPIKYIYEDSEELIEIQPTALEFDWFLIESMGNYLNDASIVKLDNKKKNELSKLGLFNNETNKLTVLGKLLHSHIFKTPALSNTMLGVFLEYKYFHFFSNPNLTPYSNPELSNKPKIWYKKINDNKLDFKENPENGYVKLGDIDLMLKNGAKTVLCEIKSEGRFIDYEIIKLQARIEYLGVNQSINVDEILLIVWKSKFFIETNESIQENNELMNKFRQIKTEIKKPVIIYGHELKLKDKALGIDYSSMFQKDIKKDDFFEIKIE